MAKAYDKDFLIAVYIDRFAKSKVVDIDKLVVLEEQASAFYDKVGKIEFRKYANVTPEAIKEYQNA